MTFSKHLVTKLTVQLNNLIYTTFLIKFHKKNTYLHMQNWMQVQCAQWHPIRLSHRKQLADGNRCQTGSKVKIRGYTRVTCAVTCLISVKWLVTYRHPIPHIWTTRPNSRARNVCNKLKCSRYEGGTIPIFTATGNFAVSSWRLLTLVAKPPEKVVNNFTITGKNMLFSCGLYFVSYT